VSASSTKMHKRGCTNLLLRLTLGIIRSKSVRVKPSKPFQIEQKSRLDIVLRRARRILLLP